MVRSAQELFAIEKMAAEGQEHQEDHRGGFSDRRIHFLERATAHFLGSTHCALAQDKVVSASFMVIPHAHSHPVSLMSLLSVPFVPFPSLLSSSSASLSQSSTTTPSVFGKPANTTEAHSAKKEEMADLPDHLPAQAMSPTLPTSPKTRIRSTIRSTFPPQPRQWPEVCRIPKPLCSSHRAAASKVSFHGKPE